MTVHILKVKENFFFILKIAMIYGVSSAVFSLIGMTVSDRQYFPNPIETDMVQHLLGHVVFGIGVGIASLSLRYVLLAGILPVVLDFDHFIYFTNVQAIERASHSIFFAGLIVVIMMVIGKKDYLLWAIAFGSVFSHIAFDIFRNVAYFPLLIPLYDGYIKFNQSDWIFFEIGVFGMTGLTTIITKQNLTKKIQ